MIIQVPSSCKSSLVIMLDYAAMGRLSYNTYNANVKVDNMLKKIEFTYVIESYIGRATIKILLVPPSECF